MAGSNSSRASRSGTAAGMRDSIKKAVTEMMVLFLLRQKPMYVYEMSQEMSRLTGGVYTFNTLYLAIYRLQEHGHIAEAGKQEADNRIRVYFKLTDAGQPGGGRRRVYGIPAGGRRRALGRRPPAPPAADGRRWLSGFCAAGGHCGVLFCDQRCGHY